MSAIRICTTWISRSIDADDNAIDRARSYAGMRAVSIDGVAIKINGKAVFQRLVLDQGYYPDGIMTAPSDAASDRRYRAEHSGWLQRRALASESI